MVRRLFVALLCSFIAWTVSLQAGSTGTSHHTPQGGAAPTNVGDYITSAMNATYHYYVEVPPSQTSLQIQIFDADIGAGAGIPEDDLNRDRLRTGNDTTATYTLRNPAGAAVTPRFGTGTNTLPANADNAWLTFYGTGNSVQDDFTTAAFSNNDGTADWAANWIETDAAGAGVGVGSVQITGGQLQMTTNGSAMARQVDLVGTNGLDLTAATLTYTFSSVNTEAGDTVLVEASNNGGGAYTTIATHTGAFASTNNSININAYIANNTRIRFRVTAGYTVAGETFFVNTVKISDGAAAPAAGHWEVQIDQPNGTAINAIGIRASDGDNTAGGTEFNVYADSFLSLGTNPDAAGGASRNYILYPWVTAGCTFTQNDFDRDTDSGGVGQDVYTSRGGTGPFTQTITDAMLSNNNVWNREDIINYTSNSVSSDYGIWELDSTITTYANGEGNYETYYAGNYLTGANPPAAQPLTAGGFPAAYRIYLPTDAGGAPVKPYIEQFITAVNGPQPVPSMGTAQTYTITVNVRNPTPWSIQFSNTNTVVANVPGSGTVYADGSTMTAGTTMVSEPGIGATGNVVWNPGTVAGNNGSATLSYNVTITPAAATTAATGDPTTGNGTRATYVDETGNATQARATYRLGGICHLKVVIGALTEAVLAEFEVDARGRVSWTSASEAGTIGYNLYREDGTKVNDRLILAGAKHYEVEDRSTAQRYLLEEITSSGRVNRHGPLVTGRRLGPEVEKPLDGPMRRSMSSEATFDLTTNAAEKVVAVMTSVPETGIVRVPFSELATRFGKTVANIEKNASKGDLSVTTGGQPVTWTSTADAVLFFGEKSDSIYSKDRIYRIDLNHGEKMTIVPVGSSNASPSIFDGQVEFETDAFAATVLPLDPESDYWFWDYVLSGDPTYGRKTFALNVPGMASANGATLQVRVQGALNNASHKAKVKLNGVPVGEVSWADLTSRSSPLALPAGVLRDGANEVEIEGVLAPSAPFDVFYVDGFSLSYKRYARPVNGAIEAKLTGALNAGPFTAAPIALDITKRLRPTLLTGGSFQSGNFSTTLPSATKSVFVSQQFVTPSGYRSSYDPTRLQRADYIVIAPIAMRSGAQALASLRQSGGMRTTVVDLEKIYDEFSNGSTTPYAIRSYIASAMQQSQRPRYIVLAGTGTLDYRGIQQAPGPVPPMMVKTADGLFASDSKIADINSNGIPDLAIGRIPVSTNAELLAYVDKLRNHAASAVDDPIVFAADANDGGTNFGRASDESMQPVSPRPKERFLIDEIGAQSTRDGVIAAWTGGTPLVNWVGHGGFDQLAASGIITAGDAPALTTTGRLPVLVAMTCTINRFEVGGLADPLGSALTRQANGGALAVWSATGLSNHENARILQRTFIQLAATKPELRLGDLIVQTLAAHPSETAGIYVLLGDPAIALELPKEITNGPPHPTGE